MLLHYRGVETLFIYKPADDPSDTRVIFRLGDVISLLANPQACF